MGLFIYLFFRKERVRKSVSEITFLSLSSGGIFLGFIVWNVFGNYYLNCWKLSVYFYHFTCKVICINKPLMLSQESLGKKKKGLLKYGVQPYYHSHFRKFCALIFFWSFSVCCAWSFSVSHACSRETSWYHSSQNTQMPLPTCR